MHVLHAHVRARHTATKWQALEDMLPALWCVKGTRVHGCTHFGVRSQGELETRILLVYRVRHFFYFEEPPRVGGAPYSPRSTPVFDSFRQKRNLLASSGHGAASSAPGNDGLPPEAASGLTCYC